MPEMVNGVDREALFQTVDAVKANPELAKFEFRLDNRWVDGGLNRSNVSNFRGTCQEIDHAAPFELVSDEPGVLLSGDQGPNPVESLLHALAGCLTTSMVYHAAAEGLQVDAVRTRFEGDLDLRGFLGLDPNIRNGYQAIRVVFEIDGNLTPQQKQDLIYMATEHSPVYDVVTHGVPVSCQLAEDAAKTH